MSTLLGIDYGKAKIGLAIAPVGGKLAVPYCVIKQDPSVRIYEHILAVCKEEDVEAIVVGIPKSMYSSQELAKDTHIKRKTEQQLSQVRSFIVRLREKTGLQVYEIDERLSTQEANRLLRGQPKDMEDAVAAMIILQTYLDKSLDVHPTSS